MFEWKSAYSLQIPEIDAQHKKLFSLAHDLWCGMSDGKGTAALDKALSQLIDYTREHFAAEEIFMQKAGFSGLAAHKAQHDQLTRQVLDFQRRFRNRELCLTIDVMNFLTTWLEHHINQSDRAYVNEIAHSRRLAGSTAGQRH